MGCGKSELGTKIAHHKSIPFIDLDQYIESEEKTTIADLFKAHGELYFRKKERFYLEQILGNQFPAIISLGGGTPCYFDNIELLNQDQNSLTVFLKTSPGELANRLLDQKDHRPMIAHLQNSKALEEFISKHLFERLPYYQRAKKIVSTDQKSIDALVEEISSLLT